MIGNTRQLSLARRRLEELRAARADVVADSDAVTYDRLILTLESDIRDFENIQDGVVTQFHVTSVDDLGAAVVKARIAAGMNQRELADELGVTEQAVQRDESTQYERAGLAKIAEVLDVLEHQLIGIIRPTSAGSEAQIVAYPAATQGRVDARRSDSSWTTSVEQPGGKTCSVVVGGSGVKTYSVPKSSQNTIEVALPR